MSTITVIGLEPQPQLVRERAVLDRDAYAEERYPLSPELREVRDALQKLRPKPAALPAAKPYVPSTVMHKKGRR